GAYPPRRPSTYIGRTATDQRRRIHPRQLDRDQHDTKPGHRHGQLVPVADLQIQSLSTACASRLGEGQTERRKLMSNNDNRVLIRKGARSPTEKEMEEITGAANTLASSLATGPVNNP